MVVFDDAPFGIVRVKIPIGSGGAGRKDMCRRKNYIEKAWYGEPEKEYKW